MNIKIQDGDTLHASMPACPGCSNGEVVEYTKARSEIRMCMVTPASEIHSNSVLKRELYGTDRARALQDCTFDQVRCAHLPHETYAALGFIV